MSQALSSLKYILLAIGAFVWWGLSPIYFKWVQAVPAPELMAQRVAWSLVFIVLFMLLFKKRFLLREIISTPKLLLSLTLSSALITTNWFLYVWAMSENQVLATSLGYFINPLISVFLGIVFLGERLNFKQGIALILVIVAVINQIWNAGELPWLALSLALSFAFYGLIRKRLKIDSFNGLLFEILLFLPFALGYLLWLDMDSKLIFLSQGWAFDLLIIFSGIVTLLPLVLFAASVKGINLSTVGFIQYLAPCISFVLAVFVFDEPFTVEKLTSFIMIWIALAFISYDAFRRLSRGG